MRRALLLLLIPAWPLSVHLSIAAGHPEWAVYGLAALLCLPGLSGLLRRGCAGHTGSLLMLLGVAVALLAPRLADRLLVLAPALLQAGLFILFASSLLPGRQPLVSRLALLIRGDLPAPVARYTRAITLAWALFFLVVLLIGLWLGRSGASEQWSLFSHLLVPLLTVLLFVLEFGLRRLLLGRYMDYSPAEFLRRLMRVDLRSAFIERS
ncbi:MAG: hypothetical protein D6717_14210 [Gammaproteobacteria bacterium]|nr:MAG: hypothetical protein D6717_14210 [Gammaproteobacteria bacterium]